MGKRNLEHYRGCLLGGAIGDSLGYNVEFMPIEEIKELYGESGIESLKLGMLKNAEISDDTQLTLFTAEGILRSKAKKFKEGDDKFIDILYHAYIRWLSTQERLHKIMDKYLVNSWVLSRGWFHALKEPEETCLEVLRENKMGRIDEPVNDSKYSGGVVRVAPIGLSYAKEEAFHKGCMCAAITHGHPSGYLSAGVFAYIIAAIIEGEDLVNAVKSSLDILKNYKHNEESMSIINKALRLVATDKDPFECINELGEGWYAEEILARALYASIKFSNDYKSGILLSVNNSGDSDGIASITGNILGAYLGTEAIPKEYLETIELYDTIVTISDDLLVGYVNNDKWNLKYPTI